MKHLGIKQPPSVIFFGSFLEYSALVLEALIHAHEQGVIILKAVVTTPPKPAGRKQELKKTPVHERAQAAAIAVYTPENLGLAESLEVLPAVDYFLTAGYGKLLPENWLTAPLQAALNIHFSLLPAYRGANPAEWALTAGETQTGISVIEMAPAFDTGAVLAQVATPIKSTDTRESVYQLLYTTAAQTCVPILLTDFAWRNNYQQTDSLTKTDTTNQTKNTFQTHDPDHNQIAITYLFPPQPQNESLTPYARRLFRDDAWISWQFLARSMGLQPDNASGDTSADAAAGDTIVDSHSDQIMSPFLQTQYSSFRINYSKTNPNQSHQSPEKIQAAFLEASVRALTGFPTVWTEVQTTKGIKRLKIFSGKLTKAGSFEPTLVQLEGQKPAGWQQIKNGLLNFSNT